jgi:putative transcriptional regulator
MNTIRPTAEQVAAAMREIDWARIDAQTDDEIARQIADNPDAAADQTDNLHRRREELRRLKSAEAVVTQITTAGGFALWRKSLKLSQAEVAAELGISRTAVRNYESGAEAVPRAITLAAAALSAGIRIPAE